jgi:FKBP-type peptidyl-prolyl cis-trans isomerase
MTTLYQINNTPAEMRLVTFTRQGELASTAFVYSRSVKTLHLLKQGSIITAPGGLQYEVLQRGPDRVHPSGDTMVTVHLKKEGV